MDRFTALVSSGSGGWWRHRITTSQDQGHTINSNVDNKKIGPVAASLTSPPVSDNTPCQVETF